MQTEIKIGRDTYTILPGDYIQKNSSDTFLFCSGDGRTLRSKGFDKHNYVVIPITSIRKIDFSILTKKEATVYGNSKVTRYYF
jgi:hypothetical protein